MRWPTLIVVSLAAAVTAASCAKGSDMAQAGGGEGTSGDPSGGGGGSTAEGTASSSAATTAQSSASVTSTSSGGCAESPCKLVEPQCGCADGEQCSVKASGRFCTAAGSAPWGEVCGAGTECEPGSLCVITKDVAPTISTCSKFCATDDDCEAPGGLCVLTLNDGMGGSIPDVILCTANCSPINNSGCVNGTSCQVGQEGGPMKRFLSFCTGAGAGNQGATCADASGCAPTFGCFDVGMANSQCLKWCQVGGGGCPAPTSCQALNIDGAPVQVGAVQYGACL